ncbi:MAG: hypothetical protein AB4042_00825 [Leptolyngbyaceae cyanobacterium]
MKPSNHPDAIESFQILQGDRGHDVGEEFEVGDRPTVPLVRG